jgi:hypothetical protein
VLVAAAQRAGGGRGEGGGELGGVGDSNPLLFWAPAPEPAEERSQLYRSCCRPLPRSHFLGGEECLLRRSGRNFSP